MRKKKTVLVVDGDHLQALERAEMNYIVSGNYRQAKVTRDRINEIKAKRND